MNVALVHEHLAQDGGAEKVVRVFQEMYPQAPLFVVVYDKKQANKELMRENIRTSFVQKLPFGVSHYQWYLPIMPFAVERYPLKGYDVVLSSTSMFSKGAKTGPNTLHVDYCHTPTRFLWSDTEEYLNEMDRPWFIKLGIRAVLPFLRWWDYRAAQRPNYIIANSREVQNRIKKYYNRDSEVVYPPVDLERFSVSDTVDDYYVTGGRLVPYKRFDLAILACNKIGAELKIFGDGPDRKRLGKLAGPTIEFVGRVSDEERAVLYQRGKAFINAQVEDFGITPVEAMASGRPVVAFAEGGALETVVSGKTGIFFHEQTADSLAEVLKTFDSHTFSPAEIRKHAESFSRERFIREMREKINNELKNWQK